jgi:glucokinase
VPDNSVIGVDVGGTKILAGIVDQDGNVVQSSVTPTPTRSEAAFLAGLEGAIAALLDEREEGDGVSAVGLGLPSVIDQRSGSALSSVHVPLAGVPIRERIADRFGIPVELDNDGNAAAIAEWSIGAGRGTNHLVMLTLGTGIGGGLILDGRPYRGATGGAAELGHIVIQHGGPPCQGTCTGHGHLEALVSGAAAHRVARELLGPGATAHELIALARAGDPPAAAALDAMGRYLGSGIASLVNVFEPELVVLGGGFCSAALDLLLAPALEVLAVDGRRPSSERVRVEPAQLGVEAGMVGAALVALGATAPRH